MKTLWLAIAGCCIVGAALLMLLGHFDGAFVVAVVGMIAWFLNYRAQIQKGLAVEDATVEDEIETDRNEED